MADSLVAMCQDCGEITGVWRAPTELIGTTVPKPTTPGGYSDISETPDATGRVHQISHGYCRTCGEASTQRLLALAAVGRAERMAAYEARAAARAASSTPPPDPGEQPPADSDPADSDPADSDPGESAT